MSDRIYQFVYGGDGHPRLTPEQAFLVAGYHLHQPPSDAERAMFAALQDADDSGSTMPSIWRWVLEWAPLVGQAIDEQSAPSVDNGTLVASWAVPLTMADDDHPDWHPEGE